jgi:hypothetical protein
MRNGGQGRNRTTDTRIFRSPHRFFIVNEEHENKGLQHDGAPGE